MTPRTWLQWLVSLPWSLRWFVVLVLIRPVLDTLYFLKDVSPFLSPLYIVGLLTPVAIVLSYASPGFPRAERTASDAVIGLWATLIFLNVTILFVESPSFDGIGIGLKLLLAPMLYFYSRHLVRSKRDLIGVLTAFLYSACLPIAMILYERLIGPIGGLVETRGGVRYEGMYADVLSYATFVMGAWLAASFFLLDDEAQLFRTGRVWKLPLFIGLWVVCLSSMHHATSWATAAVLLTLFVVHNRYGSELPALMSLAVMGVLGYYLVGGDATLRVSGMFDSDVKILRGEKDSKYAFHGRMQRWTRHVEHWQEMTPMAKALGVVMDGADERTGRIGAGIHNDFLRMLFSSGIVGLCAYLLFFLQITVRALFVGRSERYLVWSVVALMLLYSITTLPTLYSGLMYICLPALAFGSRPQSHPITAVAGPGRHAAVVAGAFSR